MFVTFEGIDGSGKTTLLQTLAESMGECPLCLTREPGGSALGKRLREIVLDEHTKGLEASAELFLFLADRAQHVAEVIKPALERGELVFCDRYTDSTLAYQGAARGLDQATLMTLNALASHGLEPDLTFLLDLPVALAKKRMLQRKGTVCQEGRFDGYDASFHETVRAGFLDLAKRHAERFCVLDAASSLEELVQTAHKHLQARMDKKKAF
ncbi:MAG: dTMP kinase [Desulfovibrio sp.]|nr:dTMP kinase [Desulfovibrio sp.]